MSRQYRNRVPFVPQPKPTDPRFKDLTGKRFGRWVVISFAGRTVSESKHSALAWHVKCDCGGEGISRSSDLLSGRSQSCGCLATDLSRAACAIHAKSNTREFLAWRNMRRRCDNPKDNQYKNYGARGIRVCDRWLHSFANFYEDMGACPPGHSLDRIDNDGNYTPENCRWATDEEQAANRRVTIKLTYNGETLTLSQWAKRIGMSRDAVYQRYRIWKGDAAKIITTPYTVTRPRRSFEPRDPIA